MAYTPSQYLLLSTAFSCMACDGDIDDREIALVRQISEEPAFFGRTDMSGLVDELANRITEEGYSFLSSYLENLEQTSLTEEQQLQIADIAIQTAVAPSSPPADQQPRYRRSCSF